MSRLNKITLALLIGLAGNQILLAGDDLPKKSNPSTTNELPAITLNGVISISGKKQALFKATKVDQSKNPAGDSSYILSEGESRDGMKVVTITESSGSVMFDNHGVVQKIAVRAANLPSLPAAVQPPKTARTEATPLPTPSEPNVNPGGVTVIKMGSHQIAATGRFKNGFAAQSTDGASDNSSFSPTPFLSPAVPPGRGGRPDISPPTTPVQPGPFPPQYQEFSSDSAIILVSGFSGAVSERSTTPVPAMPRDSSEQ